MATYRIVKQNALKTCSVVLASFELDEDDRIVIQKREEKTVFSEVSSYRGD